MTAVRTHGEPMGAGEFCVPSKSFPGETYVVVWVTEGHSWCGCPGFQRRQACRHVAEVAHAIEIEARQSLEQTTDSERAIAALKLAELERIFS